MTRTYKRNRIESPRPVRGPPSPDKVPKLDYEIEKQAQNERRGDETSIKNKNAKTNNVVLTNIRTIQDTEKNSDIELDLNWDKRIEEYRQEIERQEKERMDRINKKEQKEQSWELYRECRKYLVENSKAWEKRKIAREEE